MKRLQPNFAKVKFHRLNPDRASRKHRDAVRMEISSDGRAINFFLGGRWIYDVELSQCQTRSGVLDWIRQLAKKRWMSKRLTAIMCSILHEALDVH